MAFWTQDPGQKYQNNGGNYTTTLRHDTYEYISTKKANLEGRYVFITGASKGLGKTTALSFAAAGASGIALGARSSLSSVETAIQDAAKQAGRPAPQVISVQLDVTNRKSVETAATKVKDAFGGKLDILINNAGYLSAWNSIAESDPDEWWKDYEVNVKGTYLVTRSFVPLLTSTNKGLKTIINITSTGGLVLFPGASAYQSAKFAVMRFTEFVNKDHGEQGVICFCVHPGGVKTELAHGMPEFMHELLVDTPELAADSLVWLTKERREWLAGRYLNLQWDMEELLAKRTEIEKGDLLKNRLAINSFPDA
ncbi:oxidoreductase-like protein [Lophiotrema nucula]|uniref:Oxidoreductase-like protein n=1 Tax=Lophiotrema nucula TaxID=690887 RepID=A0A6A5ZPZ9_9PLEO|nr:oxidoreductase-like protein [Lophiotrema nucula]